MGPNAKWLAVIFCAVLLAAGFLFVAQRKIAIWEAEARRHSDSLQNYTGALKALDSQPLSNRMLDEQANAVNEMRVEILSARAVLLRAPLLSEAQDLPAKIAVAETLAQKIETEAARKRQALEADAATKREAIQRALASWKNTALDFSSLLRRRREDFEKTYRGGSVMSQSYNSEAAQIALDAISHLNAMPEGADQVTAMLLSREISAVRSLIGRR